MHKTIRSPLPAPPYPEASAGAEARGSGVDGSAWDILGQFEDEIA